MPDVAEGVLQCEAHGRAGECYILSGQYISMKELFGRVCELAGRKPPRVEVPTVVARLAAPLAEWAAALRGKKPLFTPYAAYTLQSNSNFSHDKASAAFGYHPGPLDDALRDMLCEETGSK